MENSNSNSLLIVAALIAIYLGRIIYCVITRKNFKYLIISLYISSVALNYGFYFTQLDYSAPTGVFGIRVGFDPYVLLLLVMLLFFAKNKITLNLKSLYHCLGLLAILVVSLINPLDEAKDASAMGMLYLFEFILFSYVVVKTNTLDDIFRGIWDGLVFMGAIQVVLVILYPILGFIKVTTFFKGEFVIRREERPGGVGTFAHPNVLANYMTYNFLFFVCCYFYNYRKRLAFIFCCASFFVLITTGSRTALLGAILVAGLAYNIFKNPHKPVLGMGMVFKAVLPAVIIIFFLVYFTPVGALFLDNNLSDMYLARNAHYHIGWHIFKDSPILGVGFNAHIEYIRRNFSEFDVQYLSPQFVTENPIHNIFLITASEMGILGIVLLPLYLVREFILSKRVLKVAGQDRKIYILQLTGIGCILAVCFHGFADWAPFNQQMVHIWAFVIIVSSFYRSNRTGKFEIVDAAPAERLSNADVLEKLAKVPPVGRSKTGQDETPQNTAPQDDDLSNFDSPGFQKK